MGHKKTLYLVCLSCIPILKKKYYPLKKKEKQDDLSKSCSFSRQAQSSSTFEPRISLRNICKWSSKSENTTWRKDSAWTHYCMRFRSYPDVDFISLKRIREDQRKKNRRSQT